MIFSCALQIDNSFTFTLAVRERRHINCIAVLFGIKCRCSWLLMYRLTLYVLYYPYYKANTTIYSISYQLSWIYVTLMSFNKMTWKYLHLATCVLVSCLCLLWVWSLKQIKIHGHEISGKMYSEYEIRKPILWHDALRFTKINYYFLFRPTLLVPSRDKVLKEPGTL